MSNTTEGTQRDSTGAGLTPAPVALPAPTVVTAGEPTTTTAPTTSSATE